MKTSIAFALLLAFGTVAQSTPTLLDLQSNSLSSDHAAIYIGSSRATLEAEYFNAPQQPYAAERVYPCRLKLRIFEKTRLAQSCD
jgi:hypothetical protein